MDAFRSRIPNLISILRLFSPIYLFCLYVEGYTLTFAGVAAASALSDWLDGFLARRWKCETNGGALLDIMADKANCYAMIPIAVHMWGYEWWYITPLILLLLYDATVMSLRTEGKMVFKANQPAKWKTFIEMFALNASLWPAWEWWHSASMNTFVNTFTIVELWLTVPLAIAAVYYYLSNQQVADVVANAAPQQG